MDNDLLQPGRINSLLLNLMSYAFDELTNHIYIGGDSPCPYLKGLTYQAELHSRDYPESFGIYEEQKTKITRKFGNNKEISVQEHIEQMYNVFSLLHRIGSFQLDERNPYPEDLPPDDYSLTAFDYDVSDVDEKIPLVSKLIDFYYDETRKEFEKKPEKLRKTSAKERGKKAYLWYMKYKEYEASGFDTRKIEEIFGISQEEQDILEYWIEKILPHGLATSVFAKAGSGKSNLSTFLIQAILIMKPDWDVITTLPLIFSYLMDGSKHFPEYNIDRVHFVTTSGEMLIEEAKIGLKNRIPAIILDEFDTALISIQMIGKVGTNLKDYMFVERHYDVRGPMLIYHTRKDIPVTMRNKIISADVFMVTTYHNRLTRKIKHVLSNPEIDKMATERGLYGKERYLPIPMSTLPYYNQGTSTFDLMDVDMQWFNMHLSGTKKDALKKILTMIPERGWDKKKKGKETD